MQSTHGVECSSTIGSSDDTTTANESTIENAESMSTDLSSYENSSRSLSLEFGEESSVFDSPKNSDMTSDPTQEFSQGKIIIDQCVSRGLATLMIRGLPCSLTQQDMYEHLYMAGLDGTYDFFYLPSHATSNLGYSFVNFKDVESAVKCIEALHGKALRPELSHKICSVSAAHIQGLQRLRAKFCRRRGRERRSQPVFFF
jgi:RNA recognition motif-containing protein